MQDRPDAAELAAAVAEFLMTVVRPAVPSELRFQVLVAANSCAILAREAAAGHDAARQEAERLGRLLDAAVDDAQRARTDLAAAIRAGHFDDRLEEAVAVLRDAVRAKLAVAHPGYDDFADDGRD